MSQKWCGDWKWETSSHSGDLVMLDAPEGYQPKTDQDMLHGMSYSLKHSKMNRPKLDHNGVTLTYAS